MRALAAIYIRMTFTAVEVYEILEPLLKDYRKLRLRDMGMSVVIFLTTSCKSLMNLQLATV
jgi:pre-mRNA-splicing factor 38A